MTNWLKLKVARWIAVLVYRMFGTDGLKLGAGRLPDGRPGVVVQVIAVTDLGTDRQQTQPLVQILYGSEDAQAFLDVYRENMRSQEWTSD